MARGDEALAVSFDNLSSVNNDSFEREAWGDTFYADNSLSNLGIISFDTSWHVRVGCRHLRVSPFYAQTT